MLTQFATNLNIGTAVPVHSTKAHRTSGGIAPLILYLGPKWT
jgi:hypothetical protein